MSDDGRPVVRKRVKNVIDGSRSLLPGSDADPHRRRQMRVPSTRRRGRCGPPRPAATRPDGEAAFDRATIGGRPAGSPEAQHNARSRSSRTSWGGRRRPSWRSARERGAGGARERGAAKVRPRHGFGGRMGCVAVGFVAQDRSPSGTCGGSVSRRRTWRPDPVDTPGGHDSSVASSAARDRHAAHLAVARTRRRASPSSAPSAWKKSGFSPGGHQLQRPGASHVFVGVAGLRRASRSFGTAVGRRSWPSRDRELLRWRARS